MTQMLKLIFMAYKNIFYTFFSVYRNDKQLLSKKNKKKLRKEARENYQKFSEERKGKR